MQRSIPLWAWTVLAFLALECARARGSEPVTDAVRARVQELCVERDPRRMSARELRQLPGVGHTLALVLARARDSHSGAEPLAWEDVPGIGAVRAREIRAWCRARGIEPDPLCAGERPSAWPGYPVVVERLPFWMRPWAIVLLASCGRTSVGGASAVPDVGRPTPDPTAAIQARALALLGGSLHALEAGPRGGVPVLLLHGARFSAHTWEELGTLARLAEAGHHALAIDWPGFGATPVWSSAPDASTLLTSVCDELGAERVVLVAPSMGGRFAFEFLERAPTRVAGLVAIAPAGAEAIAPEAWSTPTLLLWGERDEVVPLAQGRALAGRLGRARLEVLSGASHPCYLDQPERFHSLLLEFLSLPGAEEQGR